MKCRDCEHFKVLYEPIRTKGGYYDLGKAECKKHDMVVDFMNYGKLNKLECVEEQKSGS